MPPAQTVNATELSAKDLVVGTGDTAVAGDIVTVNYVGSLTNGTVFDASANHGTTGFTFPLGAGQVIKGWDEGVAGMKVGGKRVLVIPPSLGYGSQAVGNAIPANSTLLFEVELLKVQKGGK
jgi:FKBP-type peptidyl-prolyl cis-trans isomerase